MGILDKIKKPEFAKDVAKVKRDVDTLKVVLDTLSSPKHKKDIQQHILNIEKGYLGEMYVQTQIKDCEIPMIVLPSLNLEFEGKTSQIDYLLITRDKIYVVECKNYKNDVLIDESGNFYIKKYNGELDKKKSPITQANSHIKTIKSILSSLIDSHLKQINFDLDVKEGKYQALVVMANENCDIDVKNAPEDLKNSIISVDNLVRYIEKNDNKDNYCDEKEMIGLGEFIIEYDRQSMQNYLNKYEKLLEHEAEMIANPEKRVTCPKCNSDMMIKTAKTGANAGNEFYGCTNFPECTNTKNIEEVATKQQATPVAPVPVAPAPAPVVPTQAPVEDKVICPKCNSDMAIKIAKTGPNAGNKFYGCTNFPKCKNTKNIDEVATKKEAPLVAPPPPSVATAPVVSTQALVEDKVTCSKCNSDMAIKIAKTGPNAGNKFYGCTNFPRCKNTKNIEEVETKQPVVPPAPTQAPVRVKAICSKCNSDMLVKTAKAGNKFYGCSNFPKCKNTMGYKE